LYAGLPKLLGYIGYSLYYPLPYKPKVDTFLDGTQELMQK